MDSTDLIEIGKRIYNQRKKMGYTQEQLADMMNVSIQMISNLERGNKAIRIDNLVKLCSILNVSTDYILTGTENINDIDNLSVRLSRLQPKERKLLDVLIDYCLSEND